MPNNRIYGKVLIEDKYGNCAEAKYSAFEFYTDGSYALNVYGVSGKVDDIHQKVKEHVEELHHIKVMQISGWDLS